MPYNLASAGISTMSSSFNVANREPAKLPPLFFLHDKFLSVVLHVSSFFMIYNFINNGSRITTVTVKVRLVSYCGRRACSLKDLQSLSMCKMIIMVQM